jgi:hypothetical protein
VSFSEQPPSKQWAALKFRGERFAEVWFKPSGEPLALRFRIPQNSFQIPAIAQRLTTENLLKAVGIPTEEVESWRHGGVSHSALDGPDAQLRNPLPQPPPDIPHLEIHVCLKPPPQAVAREESGEPGIASVKWPDLEARWKTILGLEATIDTWRISTEGLQAEMEALLKRPLTPDEKLYALASDVTQWNKAKSRIHYALPKVKEFIHRATWAQGTPERKRLGEVFKDPLGAQPPLPEVAQVVQELEVLRKDRQVLGAQGATVYQECKGICGDVQAALRRLQSNAAARALKKRGATGAKGKLFSRRHGSGAK